MMVAGGGGSRQSIPEATGVHQSRQVASPVCSVPQHCSNTSCRNSVKLQQRRASWLQLFLFLNQLTFSILAQTFSRLIDLCWATSSLLDHHNTSLSQARHPASPRGGGFFTLASLHLLKLHLRRKDHGAATLSLGCSIGSGTSVVCVHRYSSPCADPNLEEQAHMSSHCPPGR